MAVGDLIDRFVRLKSRDLDDGTVYRRKLIHLGNVVLVWPLLVVDRAVLIGACAAIVVLVIGIQRRPPYASAALLTLLAFADQTAIAGAWVVFSVGDGIAGLVGRRWPVPNLPWTRRRKSVSGTIGFIASATAGLFLIGVIGCDWSDARAWQAAVLTASAAGVVEAWLSYIDDNYSVIVAAGVILDVAFV